MIPIRPTTAPLAASLSCTASPSRTCRERRGTRRPQRRPSPGRAPDPPASGCQAATRARLGCGSQGRRHGRCRLVLLVLKYRNERRAERSLGEHASREVLDAVADLKCIRRWRRSERGGKDQLPNERQRSRHRNAQRDQHRTGTESAAPRRRGRGQTLFAEGLLRGAVRRHACLSRFGSRRNPTKHFYAPAGEIRDKPGPRIPSRFERHCVGGEARHDFIERPAALAL